MAEPERASFRSLSTYCRLAGPLVAVTEYRAMSQVQKYQHIIDNTFKNGLVHSKTWLY